MRGPSVMRRSFACGRSRGRPFEEEAASVRDILLHADAPRVLGGDARDDGEAEARAPRLRRVGRVEDTLPLRFGNARPEVRRGEVRGRKAGEAPERIDERGERRDLLDDGGGSLAHDGGETVGTGV